MVSMRFMLLILLSLEVFGDSNYDSGESSHYITYAMIGSSICWMHVQYYDMIICLARLVWSCLFDCMCICYVGMMTR